MDDQILFIDKPAGMTSFGVVARIRRVLSARAGKKVKVGHTGTLDPFATGLMILVTGKKCRDAGTYTKLDKVYEATFVLGEVSTTGDSEGEITQYSRSDSAHAPQERLRAGNVSSIYRYISPAADVPEDNEPHRPTLLQIQEVARQFTGEIKQRPPIFSAIKIDGQRAYKLAREGKKVEMPERTITIYSLDIIEYHYPELKIRTHVSSGTYIRSLAVDIGNALGIGAYCKQLHRTRIADWRVEDAKKLSDFGVTS